MYWEIKCIGWSAKLAEANTLLQKPPGVHHHSPPAYEAPMARLFLGALCFVGQATLFFKAPPDN